MDVLEVLLVKFCLYYAEEPTSISGILRKGWFHGEGGSTFDAWLTSSCAQAGPETCLPLLWPLLEIAA